MPTLDNNKFIERATRIHGEKYDYSEVNYIRHDSHVTIICRQCKRRFQQAPRTHLENHGCPNCGRSKKRKVTEKWLSFLAEIRKKIPEARKKARSTTEYFIAKSESIHGKQYDYSKAIYETVHKKVVIICRQHGGFTQTANSHMQGRGCPRCDVSSGERTIAQILDNMGIIYEQEKTFPECKDKNFCSLTFISFITV